MKLTKRLLNPETASILLSKTPVTSAVRTDKVAGYAELMQARRWVLNGIPIVISTDGQVLDGRQRLLAAIKAGAGFPTVLATDVPPDVLYVIQQHRRRSFTNVLEARGIVRASDIALLLQRLIQYDDGTMGRRTARASWSRLERVLRLNPEVTELVQRPWRRSSSTLPEPVRLLVTFMGERAHTSAHERVLEAMALPSTLPAGEPGAVLQAALTSLASQQSITGQFARLAALTIMAMNATMKGETHPQLAWSYSRAFPQLMGYPPLRGSFSEPDQVAAEPSPPPDGEYGRQLSGADIAIETVGPGKAAEFLRFNMQNRGVVQRHVQGLARDMREGRWMLNPQPICFAASGRLLNGQHRLLAIIEAGVELEFPIIRNLPEEAFDTYDLEPKGNPVTEDIVPGFGDRALVAAMANLLFKFEGAGQRPRSAKATAAEVRQVILDHPRLIELRTFARQAVEYGRASVMGYGAYVIEREDRALGQQFLATLIGDGASLSAFRRRMLRLRRTGASQADQLEALLEGWRQFSQRHRPD